ncbi:MAG: SGNH/GDSL hydrolase family protein [Mangrovibacterium sp.]
MGRQKVAFLGDSMTQKRGETVCFWEYLQEMIHIEPLVYGISGRQWDEKGIFQQAQKLKAEHGEQIDAIIIFAGTNDYNHNTPLGEFFTEGVKETNVNGVMMPRKYRTFEENNDTFCGRINRVLGFLKENFPQQQIIILTPLHRAYATFKETNVQPDENFANALGLYLEDYVEMLQRAGSLWAVPVINLHTISGLYPLAEAHGRYFNNEETDRLHLSSLGNQRLAETIRYQLLSLPASFVCP